MGCGASNSTAGNVRRSASYRKDTTEESISDFVSEAAHGRAAQESLPASVLVDTARVAAGTWMLEGQTNCQETSGGITALDIDISTAVELSHESRFSLKAEWEKTRPPVAEKQTPPEVADAAFHNERLTPPEGRVADTAFHNECLTPPKGLPSQKPPRLERSTFAGPFVLDAGPPDSSHAAVKNEVSGGDVSTMAPIRLPATTRASSSPFRTAGPRRSCKTPTEAPVSFEQIDVSADTEDTPANTIPLSPQERRVCKRTCPQPFGLRNSAHGEIDVSADTACTPAGVHSASPAQHLESAFDALQPSFTSLHFMPYAKAHEAPPPVQLGKLAPVAESGQHQGIDAPPANAGGASVAGQQRPPPPLRSLKPQPFNSLEAGTPAASKNPWQDEQKPSKAVTAAAAAAAAASESRRKNFSNMPTIPSVPWAPPSQRRGSKQCANHDVLDVLEQNLTQPIDVRSQGRSSSRADENQPAPPEWIPPALPPVSSWDASTAAIMALAVQRPELQQEALQCLDPGLPSLQMQQRVVELLEERSRHDDIEDIVPLPGQIEAVEPKPSKINHLADLERENADWIKFLEDRKPVPLNALPMLMSDDEAQSAPRDSFPRSCRPCPKAPMVAAAEAALAFPWRVGTQSLLSGCSRSNALPSPGQPVSLRALPAGPLASHVPSTCAFHVPPDLSHVPSRKALNVCGMPLSDHHPLEAVGRPACLPSMPTKDIWLPGGFGSRTEEYPARHFNSSKAFSFPSELGTNVKALKENQNNTRQFSQAQARVGADFPRPIGRRRMYDGSSS